MAYKLLLERYNKDFSEEIPITLEEWKSVIESFNDFRLDEQNTIEAFYEEFNEWQPVFWFSLNSHISINARAVSPSWYNFAIKIAEHFKAIIIGEEGEIIYLPTYGGIYDDFDDDFGIIETWDLKLEQIRENKIVFDENFKINIGKITNKPPKRFFYHKEEKLSYVEKEELMKIFYSSASKTEQNITPKSLKKWWQFWK